MALRKIELEDGKYTVLHHEEHGGITVLRHGEPWRNETGDKLLLAMIEKIEQLTNENKRLTDRADELSDKENDERFKELNY